MVLNKYLGLMVVVVGIYSVIPGLIFLLYTFTGIFAEIFSKLKISRKIKDFWENDNSFLYKFMRKLYPFLF